MPSPFPEMNPYLENPELWSEVHHRLITELADAIEPNLSLKYRVAIEKRTYLSDGEDSVLVGIPDVSVFSSNIFNFTGSTTAGIDGAIKILQKDQHLFPLELDDALIPVRQKYDDWGTWAGDVDPKTSKED